LFDHYFVPCLWRHLVLILAASPSMPHGQVICQGDSISEVTIFPVFPAPSRILPPTLLGKLLGISTYTPVQEPSRQPFNSLKLQRPNSCGVSRLHPCPQEGASRHDVTPIVWVANPRGTPHLTSSENTHMRKPSPSVRPALSSFCTWAPRPKLGPLERRNDFKVLYNRQSSP